jgi:hypothetical protein
MYYSCATVYRNVNILETFDNLHDALRHSIIANYKHYSDGDYGITFIVDVKNGLRAWTGDGEFRKLLEDLNISFYIEDGKSPIALDSYTPEVLSFITSNLKWTVLE